MSWFMFDFLPVEILYAVFDYLWTNEILHSFLHISDYLDNALLNYDVQFINFKSVLRPVFDLTCRYMCPRQVMSLVLSDSHDTPYQSKLFLSCFSLEQFSHLRALTLIEIVDNSQSMFSSLDQMKHLESLEIHSNDDSLSLHILPQLTRFVAKYQHVSYFQAERSITSNQLPRLRHVSLIHCSYLQLIHIFRCAPRLVSLNISIMFEDSNDVLQFSRCSYKPEPFALTQLSLSLDMSNDCLRPGRCLSRVHLEGFLRHLPRLQQLELIVHCDGNNDLSYGNRWRIFIIEHLPLLTIFHFKFKLEQVYRNRETVIDHFRHPFWIDESRRWFVAYDHERSLLFTVPDFAPRSILYSEIPVLSHSTTLPIVQNESFYNHITELTFDAIKDQPYYQYKHVEKLNLISLEIREALVDLSQVQHLCISEPQWSLDKVSKLVRHLMPRVNKLSFVCKISLKCSNTIDIFERVRHLHMPFFAYSSKDKNSDWTQLFPCVERLSITVTHCHEMARFIDLFRHMSYGSFTINSCSINTKRDLRERRVTQEWLIKNTRRLSSIDENDFCCRFEDNNSFTVHLWITEDDELKSKLPHTSTNDSSPWWSNCFPLNALKRAHHDQS